MANIDKTSVSDEVSRLKIDFDKLCAEGKITAESKVLMSSLFMILELVLAIFLERKTKKDNNEHLRCKTPEMAIKELWGYLLAYNLIRILMAQAALLADQIPRQLSFKHTVQIWIAWQQYGGGTHDAVAMEGLLILIAERRVGKRPGRIEPRAIKRRQKQFPLLTQLRQDAREDVRKNGHPKKQR